jgi:hypothetical protein
MSRVRNVIQHRKPKPEFSDLWDALIKEHGQELDDAAKTVDVPVTISGDAFKQVAERLVAALEARYEEIDRKYEQRFLALAQPLAKRIMRIVIVALLFSGCGLVQPKQIEGPPDFFEGMSDDCDSGEISWGRCKKDMMRAVR